MVHFLAFHRDCRSQYSLAKHMPWKSVLSFQEQALGELEDTEIEAQEYGGKDI